MKTYRGKLINWQVHHLDFDIKDVVSLYPEMEGKTKDELIVITGSVYGDTSGKYQDGDHYRSSLVMTLDRDNGKMETLNSVLDLGEEGSDVVCNPITGEKDMGNDVLKIFY